MERGIIFLLGGVAAVGLAIFVLVATGNVSVDVGSAHPASLSNIGTASNASTPWTSPLTAR